MDLRPTLSQKPLNTILQNSLPQFTPYSHFNTVELNTQKQPFKPIMLEPEYSLDFKQVHSLKRENPIDNMVKEKQEQASSVFSSSSSQSSSQDSQSQNPISKIKKVPKKIDRNNNYRKYSRITPEVKERLIYLIARQNMSIKQASVKLKINYSSAKFIFSQYRDRKLQIIDRDVDRGEVANDLVVLQKIAVINGQSNENMKVLVKCSSGGKFEAESQKTYGLRQILQLYTQSPYIQPENLKIEV